MTPCLSPDEFIDIIDGVHTPDREAHLASCTRCQATLTEVQAALSLASSAPVPEPPPAFWPQLNARVRAAVDEAGAGSSWRTWLRWDVMVPIAGLTALVMALANAVDRGPAPPAGAIAAETRAAESQAAAVTAAVAAAETGVADDALALMFDLAATMPDGEWESLGVRELPDMGVAAAALADDEQQELHALLKSAVERSSS